MDIDGAILLQKCLSVSDCQQAVWQADA